MGRYRKTYLGTAESALQDADTNLKRIRTACGYTQKELSLMSGASLRSIQMYEAGHKQINKASAETVYKIARVLGCSIEELLEK